MATYVVLAKANPENSKEILAEANSRIAHLYPTSWPSQAKMAAERKWEELTKGMAKQCQRWS